MGKTLLELFKGSPQDTSVKADKDTVIEQEATGIRTRSAVEVGNPIVYGNESIRITNRTTSTLDTMKSATGGEAGDGGLIGKGLSKLTGGKVSSISQARDAINSKLGIPQTMNPSRLEADIIKISSSEPITKDNVGKGLQGTGLGQFLKDTGGGNPKTLGKQALGNGIGLAKEKLRGKLFGEQQSIGDVVGEKIETTYSNTSPYTKVLKDNRNYTKEGGDVKEFKGIDLSLVSPVYGTQRKDSIGVFGKTEYAYKAIFDKKGNPIWNKDQAAYDPTSPYTGLPGDEAPILEKSLERKYGLTNKNDIINQLSPSDEYNKEEYEGKDLIPFWISHVGLSDKPIFFRTLITGLTETVSPSWNTNSFVGNPYNFYTYTGVERNVSFNLKLYCMNPYELSVNWEKITKLTQLTYPFINKDKLMNAPIISFRIGDIYNSKIAFIENLTYTIPDDSNWETDGNVGYLPKFIDVALTFKFIESDGAQYKPYGYKLSKKGAQALNKDREASNFDTNSRVNSNGSIEKVASLPKVNPKGIVKTDVPLPTAPKINLKTGKEETKSPAAEKLGAPSPFGVQSSAKDNLIDPNFKSPNEAVSKIQSKYNCNIKQALFIMRGAKFDVEPTKNPPFSLRSPDPQALYFQIYAMHKKDWFYIDTHGGIVTIPYKVIKKSK